jgi:hypothetical protein
MMRVKDGWWNDRCVISVLGWFDVWVGEGGGGVRVACVCVSE